MLSVKFAQGAIKVVDSFNLQSHKTKHLVHHLRRLLGRRCHSALLIHEGNVDINDNCRWASAHIPAIRRENVEGVSVYNLLKYHEVLITEPALQKLIQEIRTFPKTKRWYLRAATPDGKSVRPPRKVEGWNTAWNERRDRLRNAEFRAREWYREQQKWKWSSRLKGPLRIPRHDPLTGFRVKEFLLNPEKPIWEKLESLYADDEPLEEEPEEFVEMVDQLEVDYQRDQARATDLIEDPLEISQKGLKQLSAALESGAAGRGSVSGFRGGSRPCAKPTAPKSAAEGS